jgi:ABC-type glutathione transport system ATPase component
VTLLRVRDLTIDFPARGVTTGLATVAVDRLSFDLAADEFLGLVGPSGSGKTLTLLALIGLAPAAARVRALELNFSGLDLSRLDDRQWGGVRGARIGWVGQEAGMLLDPVRTVGGQLVEVLRRHRRLGRREAAAQALEWLARVRLDDTRALARAYPHELSGGQRQRVALALAVAGQPEILLADEPTTALDPDLREQLLDLLDELRRELRLSLIHVSHDHDLLERRCDRVVDLSAASGAAP